MGTRAVVTFLLATVIVLSAQAGEFEDLGVPVTKAGLMGYLVGPDEKGEMTKLYLNFNQDGAPLFLVQIDPDTGQFKQFNAPKGPGAWGFIVGPDKKIYLGTWKGGLILRFDPKHSDKGIEVVGKPSKTESYIWMYTIGKNHKLYGCTYPNAKLISYDPKRGEMADLGRMDPEEKYSRSVATGKNGWIYVGIGFARASIVAFDPRSGKHHTANPDEHVIKGVGSVWNARDGHAYGQIGQRFYRLVDGKAVEVKKGEALTGKPQQLKDGRILTKADLNGTYTLHNPRTDTSETKSFTYKCAGSRIFTVGEGPEGVIYGSSAMPLQMFLYDPRSSQMKNLGNPTSTTGEIYSFAHRQGELYMCAYPGSWLSIYDPGKAWNYGEKPENNPYGFGRVGDGHLRPRAMIVGGDGRIYIGSLPPYGELGGAMAVYDRKLNKVVENYRHLIPNQSIVALVWEPKSQWVFGGSSIAGGGGSHPTEKDAHLFAWDPVKKRKVIDIVPVPGRQAVISMAQAKGKVFTMLSGATLVVYDPDLKTIVHQADLKKMGKPREISLQLFKDGLVYGLTDQYIFAINPETYAIREIAKSPYHPIGCGWAITDTGIYFGSSVNLMRYRW